MRYSFSPLIDQLIDSLRYLPGIGPKSAQRIAFYLLERHRDKGLKLSESLHKAMQNIKHCCSCRNFSESDLCLLCANTSRDKSLLCIVETPLDVIAIEQTSQYRGYYFVLQGHLSPLDGIGPKELGLHELVAHVEKNIPHEVILATNSTVEGEVTAHHIAQLLKPFNISKISRLAQGVPVGVELEYASDSTLSLSFNQRLPLSV